MMAATPPTDDAPAARYRTPYGFLVRQNGVPAIKPPWAQLNAYDLNSGKLLWKAPIGLDPRYGFDEATGLAAHKGGVVVTGGGLNFAAGGDSNIYAFDRDTGQRLWSAALGGYPSGNPSTYSVKGRQYIVVPAAAATAGMNVKRNAFVVFALPK